MNLKGQKEDPKQHHVPTPKDSMDAQTESEILELHISGVHIISPRLQTMACTGIIKGKYEKCIVRICAACLFWKSLPKGLSDIN